MLCGFLIGAAVAAEPPEQEEGSLEFARTAEGVAAAVGEVLPLLQDCASAATAASGVRLVRVRFDVDEDGVVAPKASAWTGEDAALASCMSGPFQALRFQPGEQVLPVEVPVSVVIEEEFRREVARQ